MGFKRRLVRSDPARIIFSSMRINDRLSFYFVNVSFKFVNLKYILKLLVVKFMYTYACTRYYMHMYYIFLYNIIIIIFFILYIRIKLKSINMNMYKVPRLLQSTTIKIVKKLLLELYHY